MNIFLILQSQILLLSITLSMITIDHIHMIIVTSAYMTISSFHINLWIQNNILQLKHSATAKFLLYRSAYTKTLLNILKGNKYYGTVFLVYLAVQFPFSCVFILKLFKLNDSLLNSIAMIFEQLFVTVAVHYLFAKSNSRLSIKTAMYHFMHSRSTTCTGSNLKMNLFIQTYHTRNPYGFTYGIFGLISMFTFFKVFLVN